MGGEGEEPLGFISRNLALKSGRHTGLWGGEEVMDFLEPEKDLT
jgi:hypothetical protein